MRGKIGIKIKEAFEGTNTAIKVNIFGKRVIKASDLFFEEIFKNYQMKECDFFSGKKLKGL